MFLIFIKGYLLPFGIHDADGTGLHSFLGSKMYSSYYATQQRKKIKQEIFSFYGDKCGICGFSDPRALQIDHVNSDGFKERKHRGTKHSGQSSYLRKVLKTPERYQLLCANCNWIKRDEKGETKKIKYNWDEILSTFVPSRYIPIQERAFCKRGHDLKIHLIKEGRAGEKFRCRACMRRKNKPLVCEFCKIDFKNYKKTRFCSNVCSAKDRNQKIKKAQGGAK